MRLSKSGCARLYDAANQPKPPDPWKGLSGCRNCSLGALHATGKPQNPLSLLAEALRMVCPRCGRMADGLINGMYCRCCHARHLEGLKRKNAKGHEPALSARLHTERMAVASGPAPAKVVTHRAVVALSEAIIHHSKSATGPTSYGRRAVQWRYVPQLEMGL